MKDKMATSGTKEGLKKMIGLFYYSDPDNFNLREDGTIFNVKLFKILGTSWSKTKNKYIFWG